MNEISQNIANESPDVIARRLIQKAHTRDGLPEIAVGMTFLTVACLLNLQLVFQPGSLEYKAALVALILVIMMMPFGCQLAIKKVRSSWLIEKSGYVRMKPVNRKLHNIVISLGVTIAAVMTFALYRGWIPSDGWILSGTGIVGGAITAFAGRIPRYVVGGVLMAVTGILLAYSRVSLNSGFTILYSLIGLYSLVSGIVVLFDYLRQPAETGE